MNLTYLRLAEYSDLEKISNIIQAAKKLLHQENIDQWQNGNPSLAQLSTDIQQKQSYVLIINQEIAAVAVLLLAAEPTYQTLTQGQWANANPYATIHRFAVNPIYRGQHVSTILISHLISVGYSLGFKNYRIDTHPHNLRMQHVIVNAGFSYRGIIQLDQQTSHQRLAYELNL